MNPGVVALERLVQTRLFEKGSVPGKTAVQYWASENSRPITCEDWVNAAGLVTTAAQWIGTRGLSTMRGRAQDEVIYIYRPEEDK